MRKTISASSIKKALSRIDLKTALRGWRREVSRVSDKPGLVFTIVTIGFFMLWLASEQVTACLRFLTHFKIADKTYTDRLKTKYIFYGLSMIAFLWVDLVLLNVACRKVSDAFRLVGSYWTMKTRLSGRDKTDAHPRRNAIRACRKETS